MGPQGIKLLLAPAAWRLLRGTLRLDGAPAPDPVAGPVIFACLHRDILPAIMYVRAARPALLVSGSPDGEILTRCLGTADYRYVRGATGEDGGRAFVGLRRALQAGYPVGVAVDGPKGPFGVVNEGVIQLSRLTGSPLVALRAAPGRHTALNTWDRTVVPHPFSRITIVRTDLGAVPREAGARELQQARTELATRLGVGGAA